jgi:ADP-ribose pyrophosphatase YjhB (NUDIX family)
MINLYLAMGGGWVNEAEKVTDAVARTDPGVAQ